GVGGVSARQGARGRRRQPRVHHLGNGGGPMRRRLTVALSIAVLIGFLHPLAAAAADADACIADARTRAAAALEKGAGPYDARRQLEIDVLRCQDPAMPDATAHFIGTINADLAEFAQQFMLGQIDTLAYRNARLDRSRKLRQLGGDRTLHIALERGDADGDLVPDTRDRCRMTPRGTP